MHGLSIVDAALEALDYWCTMGYAPRSKHAHGMGDMV